MSEVKKEGRGALIIYIHNWKPFFKKDAHVDFNLQASFFFFSFFLLFVLGFPSLAIIYIGIHMKKRKKKKKKSMNLSLLVVKEKRRGRRSRLHFLHSQQPVLTRQSHPESPRGSDYKRTFSDTVHRSYHSPCLLLIRTKPLDVFFFFFFLIKYWLQLCGGHLTKKKKKKKRKEKKKETGPCVISMSLSRHYFKCICM